MTYLLTMKGGEVQRWSAGTFHDFVKCTGQRLEPHNKLAQLQRYTGLEVVDWELIEDGVLTDWNC